MNLAEVYLATKKEGQMLDAVKQAFESQYPLAPQASDLADLDGRRLQRSQRWSEVITRFTQALDGGNLLNITPEEIVTGKSHTDQEEKQ